jgi:polyphosphate kinase
VTVLVELKARAQVMLFSSSKRALERAGVHVVYGLVGLKTHAKIALIVRRENDGLRRYVHLGTGNYNAGTARVYTDLGLLTCNPDLGADASDLFNLLTGYSRQHRYRKLLVAPVNLRERLTWLIEREIAHANSGRGGSLIFKLNSLVDPQMIELLYRASQVGVKVELIVRGMCCLRPGVAGLSENIIVRSVVGRFLEHSRIYYFENGGDPVVYLGSADLMQRNLDRRIETLFPIEDAAMIRHIRENLLATYLNDNFRAKLLMPDGSYMRAQPEAGAEPRDSQAFFAAGHDTPPE